MQARIYEGEAAKELFYVESRVDFTNGGMRLCGSFYLFEKEYKFTTQFTPLFPEYFWEIPTDEKKDKNVRLVEIDSAIKLGETLAYFGEYLKRTYSKERDVLRAECQEMLDNEKRTHNALSNT